MDNESEQPEKTQLAPEEVAGDLANDADVEPAAPAAPAPEEAPAPAENPIEKRVEKTADECKAVALEHLRKKLHRAKKFAQDEAAIEALERQVARTEKFGLDRRSQLARELGLGLAADDKPRGTIAKRKRGSAGKRHGSARGRDRRQH